MEHALQPILENVSKADSLNFYFILRKEKENLKSKRKVLEKYDFSALRVDINEEIKTFLHSLVIEQLQQAIEKELELNPYEVIADDEEQVFTYSELNKIGSFAKVVNEQLPHRTAIHTMQNFDEVFSYGSIWAYCIELSYKADNEKRKYIYTFRKLNAGNIIVDERDNINKGMKHIMASFGTNSNKLEMFKGSTVKLDAIVDCVYDSEQFYILQKHQFETLVGMAEDFLAEALSVVDELKELDKISGIEHIAEAIENKTAIHKKIVRLKKLQNYRVMDDKMIALMKKAAKTEKYKLQLNEEGKIVIQNPKDVDMVIKLLCDYYKQGVVTGKNYGTYSGKYFAETDNQ